MGRDILFDNLGFKNVPFFSFFRKQKELAEEKRKVAKLEIERQKEIMQEKERLIQAFIKVFKGTASREGKFV